jgi:demethylmenaquinone methyltransferase/2-methoxy-6-polyprenyl-1,4-benzoquinol methylase
LRNLSNVESGLAELSRVLKPGGWVAVLEFSRPANAILRPLFNLYFRKVLPLMGGLVSGSAECLYLSTGVGPEVSGPVPTLAPDGAGRIRSGSVMRT